MANYSDAEINRWIREFQKQHGRLPTGDDVRDYVWSRQFQDTYGRPPTENDWRAHWYASRGTPPPSVSNQPSEQTVGEILGVEFPQQAAQLPTYLRDWVRYLEETVQNAEVKPTNPLATKVEAGQEATPFQQFQQETARQLGLDSAGLTETDWTQGWQKFIDALMKAPFSAQQRLASLRWDTKKGWYRTQVPMLANPGEL